MPCGVEIEITQKCNLKCEYCLIKERDCFRLPLDQMDMTAQEVLGLIGGSKLNFKRQSFSITGGEPLLFWDEVNLLFSGLRDRFPDNGMQIFTNGTLLTNDAVRFCNNKNIGVRLSMHRPDLLDPVLISRLDDCVLKMVVDPRRKYAEEIRSVHEQFNKLIEIRPDVLQLNGLTEADMKDFVNEYEKVKDISIPNYFSRSCCNCWGSFTISKDVGIMNRGERFNIPKGNKFGCAKIIKRMSAGKYLRMVELLEDLERDRINDARDIFDYVWGLVFMKQMPKKRISDSNAEFVFNKLLEVM